MSLFEDDLDEVDVSALDVDDEWGRGKGADPISPNRPGSCGAVWFGHRIEHCMLCHQTFSGASTGDAHRVGPHPQRCLTADELTGLGLWVETNQYGTDVWHGSPNKKGIQKRRPIRERA